MFPDSTVVVNNNKMYQQITVLTLNSLGMSAIGPRGLGVCSALGIISNKI